MVLFIFICCDIGVWYLQVWVFFGFSVMFCGLGLVWLLGVDLDWVFMVMGYVFCLFIVFVLVKFICDNQDCFIDMLMWCVVVWSGFVLVMGLMGWGLYCMEIQLVWKVYFGVCWFYLIFNVFMLVKMLCDVYEVDLMEVCMQGCCEVVVLQVMF